MPKISLTIRTFFPHLDFIICLISTSKVSACKWSLRQNGVTAVSPQQKKNGEGNLPPTPNVQKLAPAAGDACTTTHCHQGTSTAVKDSV